MTRLRTSASTLLATAALVVPAAVLGAPTAHAAQGCVNASAPLTVEEQRLAKPIPQEILRRSGFDSKAPDFLRRLCAASTPAQARRVVTDSGRRLWRAAVDRAQGRGPTEGGPSAGGGRAEGLNRSDDRPLYWARLGMTRYLRQWRPRFPLSERERAALLLRLERTSRGEDSVDLPTGDRIKRVVVTGFDPFTLDTDMRIGNPSGANALALDGVTLRTAAGPVRIETVIFPVRWDDFADGTVERTLLPYFRPGPQRVDMFVTVSQGRVGRFDVERWNGAWRGGFPDNDNLSRTGTVPLPAWVPGRRPQPQWTVTTLPYERIVRARTGPFPVYDHTEVTELPAGQSTPVTRPDGPTPGSMARAGGGGDYLSNEIAYRATRLRDAVGLDVPGGHVHTPVLEFAPGSTSAITDPVFEHNRAVILAQLRAIITTAADALR
ncbi:pyroglutamyl peptidase [Streptomyces sp. RPT161]|uniref:pyroglutamyl peptidase n=1 Tax=Streptomyces sp. RPT161 TaxID=3015993 RepID=UPI0022B9322C|nr:pyroglutamyl peptidase [Streptomyces sp. RPT161]